MKTKEQKLNDVWCSGYCAETVEAGRRFADDPEKRIAHLTAHIGECQSCQYANFMKGLERNVAEEIGVLDEFFAGEDIHLSPGFEEALKKQVEQLLNDPDLDPQFVIWWGGVSLRRDYAAEREQGDEHSEHATD